MSAMSGITRALNLTRREGVLHVLSLSLLAACTREVESDKERISVRRVMDRMEIGVHGPRDGLSVSMSGQLIAYARPDFPENTIQISDFQNNKHHLLVFDSKNAVILQPSLSVNGEMVAFILKFNSLVDGARIIIADINGKISKILEKKGFSYQFPILSSVGNKIFYYRNVDSAKYGDLGFNFRDVLSWSIFEMDLLTGVERELISERFQLPLFLDYSDDGQYVVFSAYGKLSEMHSASDDKTYWMPEEGTPLSGRVVNMRKKIRGDDLEAASELPGGDGGARLCGVTREGWLLYTRSETDPSGGTLDAYAYLAKGGSQRLYLRVDSPGIIQAFLSSDGEVILGVQEKIDDKNGIDVKIFRWDRVDDFGASNEVALPSENDLARYVVGATA